MFASSCIWPLRFRQDVDGELALTRMLLPGECNNVPRGPGWALSMAVGLGQRMWKGSRINWIAGPLGNIILESPGQIPSVE